MLRLNLSEHDEQVRVCRWLDSKGLAFFAVPNGAALSMSQAVKLKREGMRPGAPDLVLVDRARDGSPVAIEMKRKRGAKYSAEQIEMHARLRANGWYVIAPPSGESATWVIRQLETLYG